ncbi:MAG: hypothetical protein ACT443_04230, partial [Gemmatimonadota bacterium]
MNYPHLAEQAVLNFLKLQPLTTLPADASGQRNLYKSSDSPDGAWPGSQTPVKMPCAIIECALATPYAQPAGNEECEMMLHIRTQRDDGDDASHRVRCEEVFNLFRRDDIKSHISDAHV